MFDSSLKFYSLNASQFLLCLFEHYHEGVLIVDHNGILVYYNKALARLDGLDHQDVLGRHVTEIYQLGPSQSTSMLAMSTARPIINRPHIYRTVDGKLVNSISSAYPLYDKSVLIGAICTVTDYSSLMENYSKTEAQSSKQAAATKSATAGVISFDDLIGRDEKMMGAIDVARRAASTPSAVMLVGETGTGKELFAKAVHYARCKKSQPFMAINCAAIPGTLLEGVLFGTSKGAFTGAVDKAGLFELADGGTIFLDELNSMPIDLQPKLLRVVQDHCVRRVGSSVETPISVKIISALNISPFVAIESGTLRPDLFYRLGVVMVNLPPLRERRADIPILLKHFLDKFNQSLGKSLRGFTVEAQNMLMNHHWPGNVREMEHAVEAAMNYIDASVEKIGVQHIQAAVPLINFSQVSAAAAFPVQAGAQPEFIEPDEVAMETALVTAALRKTRGNVARAARRMGYSPQRLHYRLKKLGLDSADFK